MINVRNIMDSGISLADSKTQHETPCAVTFPKTLRYGK